MGMSSANSGYAYEDSVSSHAETRLQVRETQGELVGVQYVHVPYQYLTGVAAAPNFLTMLALEAL